MEALLGVNLFKKFSGPQFASSDLPECSSKKGGIFGYISCSTMTVLKTVRKADQETSFELLPGVSFVKEGPEQQRRGKELKVEELPTDTRFRAMKLVEMLVEASANFISGRALKISLPKMGPVGVARALEEGVFCFVSALFTVWC